MKDSALVWARFLDTGDESSFSSVYNHHADRLYAYGISLGFDTESCKDAIQDVFYKLYLSRNNLRHVQNLTAYLFKAYKHRLIDLTKNTRKNEAVEPDDNSFAIRVTILDHIIDAEESEMLRQKIEHLLSDLSPRQREAVYMRYMLGLEYDEISAILNISRESARKLIYRSIDHLRKKTDWHEAGSFLSLLFFL